MRRSAGLEFQDYLLVDQEVDPKLPARLAEVIDFDGLLGVEKDLRGYEFVAHRLVIHGLRKPRSQDPMHLLRAPDNPKAKLPMNNPIFSHNISLREIRPLRVTCLPAGRFVEPFAPRTVR